MIFVYLSISLKKKKTQCKKIVYNRDTLCQKTASKIHLQKWAAILSTFIHDLSIRVILYKLIFDTYAISLITSCNCAFICSSSNG